MNDNFYKVLWIDDEKSIVESTQKVAEGYNLNLVHFTNWEEAKEELEHNFDEYSAIILDAYCKIKADRLEEEIFINSVLPQMGKISGNHHKDIPWYILSAGTMDGFNKVIESASNSRETKEWGAMLYKKGAPDGDKQNQTKLFGNIQRVASEKGLNIILHRYDEVFRYLGEDKLMCAEAREYMLKMLSALYYPEENIGFQYEANPIRKVVEYLFEAAYHVGLLAEECYVKGNIIIAEASLYMAGKNTKYSGVRYGNAGSDSDGGGGDAIFSSEIAQVVWSLLNYSNSGSHAKKKSIKKPYIIDADSKELFFGYVLQLCHVIKWFGNYVDKHPDADVNKSKKRLVEASVTAGDKKTETTKLQDKNNVLPGLKIVGKIDLDAINQLSRPKRKE